MSHLAAARHLFAYSCCPVGRRLATEVTRAEADLRTAARSLARSPESGRRHAAVDRAKAKRADLRARLEAHEAECDTGEPVCRDGLCRDGEPCAEHRRQVKESAARDAAERNRP